MSAADGVYTVVLLVVLLKLPVPLLFQVALEALPPKSPVNEAVAPWHIV